MLTIIGDRGDATFRAISVGWVGRSARLQSNCPRAYWGTGIIPFACVSFFFSSFERVAGRGADRSGVAYRSAYWSFSVFTG